MTQSLEESRPGTLRQARELRLSVAVATEVQRCPFPGDGWIVDAKSVRNDTAPFFELMGLLHPDGVESLLIRQTETALVGLALCDTDHGRFLLLNARGEPGLHGVCQFSTTIQSTPSNYQRRHGGRATPLIDMFVNVDANTVIHDSRQFDLGAHYHRKSKRFLIIRLKELVQVEEPLIWLAEGDVRRILREHQMTTSDLRVAMALLDGLDSSPPEDIDVDLSAHDGSLEVDLGQLQNWAIDEEGIREVVPHQHVRAIAVTTVTSSREVTQWSQPLLMIDHDLPSHLAVTVIDGEERFAVARRTQRGLAGIHLWHPAVIASVSETSTIAHRRLSAEGGRFWKHGIDVSLVRVRGDQVASDARWFTLEELEALMAMDLTTTVELRLAISLAQESRRGL